MNLTVNGKKIKAQTLILLGIIVAGSAASQITAVNHFLSYHPRLAPLGGFLLSAITLLHEPWVRQLIFEQTTETPDAKVDTTISVSPPDVPVTPPKA